jgi:hypothetical protein
MPHTARCSPSQGTRHPRRGALSWGTRGKGWLVQARLQTAELNRASNRARCHVITATATGEAGWSGGTGPQQQPESAPRHPTATMAALASTVFWLGPTLSPRGQTRPPPVEPVRCDRGCDRAAMRGAPMRRMRARCGNVLTIVPPLRVADADPAAAGEGATSPHDPPSSSSSSRRRVCFTV